MEYKDFIAGYLKEEYERTKDDSILPLLDAFENTDVDIIPPGYRLMKNGGKKFVGGFSDENLKRINIIKSQNVTDVNAVMKMFNVSYSTAYRLRKAAGVVEDRKAPVSKKAMEERPKDYTAPMSQKKTTKSFSIGKNVYEHLLEMKEQEMPDASVSVYLEQIIEDYCNRNAK